MPEPAIPVGQVMITRTDGGRVPLTRGIPRSDLPAGLYHVQYCNDPCTGYTVVGLGDLIGSETFAIGATVAEGRLLMLAQRLRSRIDEVSYRLRQEAASRVRTVERELSAAMGRQAIAEVRAREFAATLRTTRRTLEAERSTVAAAFVITSGLMLVVIALLVMLLATTRRLRASRLDTELQAMTQVPRLVDSS